MRQMKSYLAAISLFLLVLGITLGILYKNQKADHGPHGAAVADKGIDPHSSPDDSKPSGSKKTAAKGQEINNTSAANSKDTKTPGIKNPGPAKTLTDEEIKAKIRAGEPGYEVFASRLTKKTLPLKPTWSKGDDWIVETYYRQMQAPGDVWTGPAKWRFRVANEVSYKGEQCWQFVVSRVDDPKFPPSTVYITRDSHQLAGLESSMMQKGERRKISYSPGKDERSKVVEARMSIIPFDLPGFGATATVVPAGLNTTPAFLRRKDKMPKDSEILGHGDESFKIRFSQPSDKTRVRQRWASTDLRWPVESRTETTWSFRRKKR
ncbi:MAG: hypothetical protein P1V97_31725 [Planctomycetota bacterium]|nr:hypothetical protein [Planctomycetota bacterium]